MARPTLRLGTVAVAQKLQEAMDAGDALGANDVRTRLSDALQDQSSGKWCYYIDHFGDGESGEVIFSCDGDITRAPYEISGTAGSAAKCVIDMDQCEDVVPRTVYEVEQDDEDSMAAMEALRAAKLYGEVIPVYERFISKATRDNATSSDFAGKGKSFPILKAEDVMAAASSLGRAGSGNLPTDQIKANIIRIAKRKGFPLPKAWQKGAKESAAPVLGADIIERLQEAGRRHSADDMAMIQQVHDTAKQLGADCTATEDDQSNTENQEAAQGAPSPLKLVESGSAFCEELRLNESARTNYPILIISPGTGSTAHYPAETLQREASKFKPGTLMFWNHATPAQEAARPEGDLNDLAAILTKTGEWKSSGPKGPGIYAEAKVMSDYAEKLAERAPHIGVSIRAGGLQEGTKTVDGKPVLKEFTHIESVDYVTKAGRGGLALAEAARAAGLLEEAAPAAKETAVPISEYELKALKENNRLLMERAVFQDAQLIAREVLDGMSLPLAAKRMVIEDVIGVEGARKFIPTVNGGIDGTKFREMVDNRAKSIGRMLSESSGGSNVFGMGVQQFAPQSNPEQIKAREASRESDLNEFEGYMSDIMGNREAAKRAVRGVN